MHTMPAKLLSLFLCLMILFTAPMSAMGTSLDTNADEDLVDFVPEELSPEELEQWAEWANAEGTDANAENAADLSAEEEALMDELASMLDDTTPTNEVDLTNLEPNPDLPDHVVNILLLGVDNRSVALETGRSDAVIICSINKETGSVKLTSIARDTAVIVPGYKNRKRMNTAYKFGGAELAMKTVNRNFQMNIERYVVVNIHGLADIIESLGGVDIELAKAEASAINYELHVKEPMDKVKREKLKLENGVQHLDGMQAVTYARIRNLKGQNDINRNARQRHLLQVLLTKVMDGMDIAKFIQLVETALPYGETNLTLGEMMELGTAVLGGEAMKNLQNGGDVIEQFSIPMEKEFGYRTFEGVSLVYISDKRMQTTLTAMQEFLYGQSYVK